MERLEVRPELRGSVFDELGDFAELTRFCGITANRN
jgi:hypothetical protein